MRTIIYDEETLEPLTVVNIPSRYYQYLEATGSLKLALPQTLTIDITEDESFGILPERIQVVDLYAHPLMKDNVRHLMVTTRTPELVLHLESVFLPGQQKEVRRKYKEGIRDGIRTTMEFIEEAMRKR